MPKQRSIPPGTEAFAVGLFAEDWFTGYGGTQCFPSLKDALTFAKSQRPIRHCIRDRRTGKRYSIHELETLLQ